MAQAEPDYLAELRQQARSQALAGSAGWQALLHYADGHSTVDDPGFFVAPAGKRDAQAELDATLALFFSDVPRDDEPPQCRLRARYLWLRERLGFDPQRLPEQGCERYDTWRAGLNVERLALVFASSDLGSPSTMFGHTLLRLDARGQDADSALLAYAVNYAAYTGPDAGLLYAVRGLTGSYQGYFGLFPYYEKVKEYVRIEHRDLWEYPLHLSTDETDRLLAHLWELRGIGSDYYFFTENCSQQLLMALDAVRPELSLAAHFRGVLGHTIPVDSVRLLQRRGLLGAPQFRPASAKQLQTRFHTLDRDGQRWLQAYVRGRAGLDDPRLQGAPAQQQARMLDLAHDLSYFRFQTGAAGRDEGLKRARGALIARSRIPTSSGFPEVPRPAHSPDQGHASHRSGLGVAHADDTSAGLLSLRAAYHDRLDPAPGYIPGAELEFLNLRLLYTDRRVALDHATLLKIEALAPRDRLFTPWSWRLDLGARRPGLAALETTGVSNPGAYLDLGLGMSWAPAAGTQLYFFGGLESEVQRELDRGHALSGSARLGAARQWARINASLELDALGGLSAAGEDGYRARGQLHWQPRPEIGLRLGLEYGAQADDERTRSSLTGYYYF
ncbi:MAG: DUF4105 domain-containing protein [Gammaproteobacteria bacterium]